MKTTLLLVLPLCLGAQTRLTHNETIQRSFPATKSVGVANISGSIHVTGYNGNEVQMTAVRTDQAETQDALARAAREVKLVAEVKDGQLQIYPDGPFREDQHHNPFDRNSFHDKGYHFDFDITLKVPTSTDLDLRNVNKGEITVQDVHGHFDVKHVNGPIDLKGMAGSGDVSSVNGGVHVAFSQNPAGPCRFKTVNGAIDVELRSGANADLEYKTVHGGIYTDFDLAGTVAPVSGAAENKNGKFVYRSHGLSRARIGAGGPLLTFETVNGEIRIRRR